MTGMLIAVMLMAAPPQQGNDPPPHVKKYLQRCEEVRKAAIATTERTITLFELQAEPKPDALSRLKAQREELARLKSRSAPLATLPLPPEKDDIGAFEKTTVNGRQGRFVNVLEVIDKNSAVIRVWYTPSVPTNKVDADKQVAGNQSRGSKKPVPLDFWAQGIDTTGMKDHSQAELPQVFHALGNKGLPTDCGTRSLPVLTPIDVERFRGDGQ